MKAIQTDAEEHVFKKFKVLSLIILWESKDILEEKGIKYYMLGGTLLGAVRHQGFITWDDDIDIGIEREDYERLLVTVAERLPDYLELQTFKIKQHRHYFHHVTEDMQSKETEVCSKEKKMCGLISFHWMACRIM